MVTYPARDLRTSWSASLRFAGLLLLTLAAFGASPDLRQADAAPVSYDEGVSGDLSSVNTAPVFTLDVGVNVITGTVESGVDGADGFQIDVAAGTEITAVRFQYTDLDPTSFADSGNIGSAAFSTAWTGGSTDTNVGGWNVTTPALPIGTGSINVVVAGSFAFPAAPWTLTLTVGATAGGGDTTPPDIDCPSPAGIGQVIDQPLTDGSITGGNLGQSFTASITGTITSIGFHPGVAYSDALTIYDGAGNGGTLLHTQAISSTGDAFQTFTLTTPVAVNPGVYTFYVGVVPFPGVRQRSGNVYPDGIAYSGASTVGNTDLTFRVDIAAPATTVFVEECTSPSGAVVTFPDPTVTDDTDPSPSVVCVPASGSTFPKGTTTVVCTATDAAGNAATCSFDVEVEDTTAPAISCPADVVAECDGAGGATVSYPAPVVTDACDPSPVVVCTPAAGSLFPFGLTTVNCTATDADGNASACSFTVQVVDTTAPAITCPGDILGVECAGPTGTVVTYTAPVVSDVCDPSPTVVCTPASGSAFPLGRTTVTCTATDATGNSSACTFDVEVVDRTPPVLTCALARTLLWPARNGLMPLGLTASATDLCDPAPTVSITVYSDEPAGLAPFAPDAIAAGTPGSLRLRAERAYPGDGRVYLLVIEATDAAGNATRLCKSVVVPVAPTGAYILGVRAQAMAAEAACSATGLPPAGYAALLSFVLP